MDLNKNMRRVLQRLARLRGNTSEKMQTAMAKYTIKSPTRQSLKEYDMMMMTMMMMKTLELDQTRLRRQRGEEPKSQSLPRNHPPPRKPLKMMAVNTAGEDVVRDEDQPQDTSRTKT
ncbi:hypothetical protein Tco_0981156 [Tanacetum coccineum]